MASRRKEVQAWTIRNQVGQYIGCYRALTAEQAISRFMDDQLATASQFKRHSVFSRDNFTAKVEK